MDKVWRMALAVVILAAPILAGCAQDRSNTTYSRSQLGQAAVVTKGQIVSMRSVRIAGSQSGVGLAGGAVAGGIAGSYLGGGHRANALGVLGGALVGGAAGAVTESALTEGNAVEFTVREDNGQVVAVVQTNEEQLRPGERVLLIGSRDKIRIARALQGAATAQPAPAAAATAPVTQENLPAATSSSDAEIGKDIRFNTPAPLVK